MKTLKTFFALSLFALTLNSCDAVEDLVPDLEVNLNDLSASGTVVIPEGNTSVEQDYVIEIEDEDVLDNLNRIKVVAVQGFTYTISNVTATEGTTLTGTISNGDKPVTLTNVAIANGTTGTVSDPAFINALQNDFKSDAKATVSVDGTISNADGATFTLTIKSNAKVTVGL